MTPEEIREVIIKRIQKDLVGPDSDDEVLKGSRLRPSDVYLTGILWPVGEKMGSADDDGSSGDSEEEDSPSTPGPVGQQRPCSMGISFATTSDKLPHSVLVVVHFAAYVQEEESVETKAIPVWRRQPFSFRQDIDLSDEKEERTSKLEAEQLEAEVYLHARTLKTPTGLLSTITIINRSKTGGGNRNDVEKVTLFQAAIEIFPNHGTQIVAHPSKRADSEEEKLSRLLYRDCPVFATGHQCSAGWRAKREQPQASSVYTCWIPETTVPAVSADGHEVFRPLMEKGVLNAMELATSDDTELTKRLSSLADSYESWINIQGTRVEGLSDKDMKETALANIKVCGDVLKRIRKGVSKIDSDENIRLSFRLANHSMALQHSWKKEYNGKPLIWRPFQLGFILLAADSTSCPASDERNVLDLLWFPTGGGKTEAYLAIVAMLTFHRRLRTGNSDDGGGNAAIMRYTLRLLTAQQFERASSLILAADLIRSGKVKSKYLKKTLGKASFSIGIWVGRDATPNDYKTALQNKGTTDGCTAEQITFCPCCGSKVYWNYDNDLEEVRPSCDDSVCQLGQDYGKWPVYTVDTDIYREKPTLLIGTIDKFALLPSKKEISSLFGMNGKSKPDLIIQDELHLISGPLGTIAGLYETALDWLLSDAQGRRPKVIGSTATIRRASDQIRNLFDRDTCQFPPLGLDHDDSGFAVRDDGKPGRTYLGVTTAGRSAKFVLQAVSASLLQSAGPSAIPDDEGRDGYSTLLCYFNSLRELGGAIVQMLDDVPDSIALYAKRRGETERRVKDPAELTSRVSQKEIVGMLSELKRPAGDPNSVDVVLATNMVSVGVDVSRLGLLVVNGQPKTRSEYIQATSRVGRAKFPGLVITILNAAKPRDRSHYETFPGWHVSIYKDVEATSVTPFASRARDRCLHAILVSMIRHGEPAMHNKPSLDLASDMYLQGVVGEIERRIGNIDPRELESAKEEIDKLLDDWAARRPNEYMNDYRVNVSLMQSADRHVRRRAAGLLTGAAWPTMNNMRSVEPSTRFRMKEERNDVNNNPGLPADTVTGDTEQPRWRRKNA